VAQQQRVGEMGPTNVALVKLFQADQQLRAARERLDAAAKNVRVQERRVNDLAAKLAAAEKSHKELQAKAGNLDLDLKTRDAHLEKLRTQQQSAKNNKEYQAFLIEINTAKVDKSKVEEEAIRVMEQVDKAAAESAMITTQVESERKRLTELAAQIDDTLKALQAEVDAFMPARQEAAAALPPKVLAEFDRLAERFDGEALSALARPDRRREEYLCTACNMDLVTDVYNKLHSRDDLVFCPSCRRMLYIPEDLPPQAAINTKSVRAESA
jgi:predicted  nucleic acid-binding Zn-ribbon protein